MSPTPDHGEQSYEGHGRLKGKCTLITGADSGIGRAVAIAFAREGADVVISYLEEDDDARVHRRLGRAGRAARRARPRRPRRCAALPRARLENASRRFGRIDVLVNNAAFQRTYAQRSRMIPDDEWDRHWRTNVSADVPSLQGERCRTCSPAPRSSTRRSINADQPKPTLLPYATTKGAIVNFSAGLAQLARRTRHPRQLVCCPVRSGRR